MLPGGCGKWRSGILAACLLASLCGLSEARQLSDLRSDVRVLISDSGGIGARYRFTDTQITDLLNECQRDAVAQTWPLIKATNIALVAGTTYYGLPNTFLAVKRVTWRNRVLPEKSPVSLDSTKEWETVSGVPQNYFITFASRTTIGIYPWPADSSSTGTIKIDFYSQADDLSATTDQPFNNVREFYPMHHALAYCSASRLAAIDGQGDVAGLYLQLYIQTLSRLGGTAMGRPSYTPSITPSSGSSPP